MFKPKFTITNKTAASLTKIERARGFLDAAKISESWIKKMQENALLLEAHHTTHIEGTQLTLEQSERLLAGEKLKDVDPNDAREVFNATRFFIMIISFKSLPLRLRGG